MTPETHILHWLLNDPYWLSTQGIVQNSTIIGWTLMMLAMWHVSCDAHWWCWRPGRHAVTGTSWKTCDNHKTTQIHHRLRHEHGEQHPEREE